MAGDAEAESTDSRRSPRAAQRQAIADGNAEPRRYAEMVPQQRRDIGADAHKAAMAERDQTEAAHHRPRRVGKRPDQDQDQDVQVVGIAMHEGQRNQRRAGNPWSELRPDSRAPRQQPGGPDEHHDDEEGEGQHVTPFEIGKQARRAR